MPGMNLLIGSDGSVIRSHLWREDGSESQERSAKRKMKPLLLRKSVSKSKGRVEGSVILIYRKWNANSCERLTLKASVYHSFKEGDQLHTRPTTTHSFQSSHFVPSIIYRLTQSAASSVRRAEL